LSRFHLSPDAELDLDEILEAAVGRDAVREFLVGEGAGEEEAGRGVGCRGRGKGEMRGFLRCGGKCAASGRDDGIFR
jgi:hypothetical protein